MCKLGGERCLPRGLGPSSDGEISFGWIYEMSKLSPTNWVRKCMGDHEVGKIPEH